jgi:hypothetical protein
VCERVARMPPSSRRSGTLQIVRQVHRLVTSPLMVCRRLAAELQAATAALTGVCMRNRICTCCCLNPELGAGTARTPGEPTVV